MRLGRFEPQLKPLRILLPSLVLAATLLVIAPALSDEDKYRVKRTTIAPGKLVVEVEGALTDHPERVFGLAQLNAAQYALKSGFRYFRITDTKKAIKCINSKEFGTITGGQAQVGNAFLGNKKQKTGFIDAKQFVAKYQKKLLREPTKEGKQKVASAFVAYCLKRASQK